MKFLYSKKEKSEFSYVSIIIFTGFAFESYNEKGIAHLLEHIVTKDSSYYKDYFTLFSEMNKKGIIFNASTSNFFTIYYMNCANAHLKDAIDLLFKIVFFTNINKKDLENEKKIVINELKQRISSPDLFTINKSESIIFKKDNPLFLDTNSEINNVKNCSFETISNFYKKYYTLNNSALYINSSYQKNKINKYFMKSLNKYNKLIDSKNNKDVNMYYYFDKLIPNMISINKSKKIVSFEKYFKNNSSSFIYFCQAIPYEINPKEFAALFILKNYIASTLTSLFFIELREKRQLIYSPSTDLDFYPTISIFTIDMFAEKKNRKKIIKIVKNYFENFKKKLIPLDEFNKFKTVSYYNIKRFIKKDSYKMDYVVTKYFFKNVNNITSDLWIKYIKQINREYLKQIINKYFDDKYLYIFTT